MGSVLGDADSNKNMDSVARPPVHLQHVAWTVISFDILICVIIAMVGIMMVLNARK